MSTASNKDKIKRERIMQEKIWKGEEKEKMQHRTIRKRK